MANPFGSADEALTKNNGHTNAANLIFAWIPRSTTKIVEVVNAATINPAGGNYDADGYWRFNSTTRTEFAFTISPGKSPGNAFTVITSNRYNSGGDVSVALGHVAGMFATGSTTPRFFLRMDRYARSVNAFIRDNAGNDCNGLNSSLPDPGNDTFGAAVKGTSGSQKAIYRVSGASTTIGTDTSALISTSDASLDRIGVLAGTKYAHQYVFVYNAALSDADINAIIDNPGGVINVASGGFFSRAYYDMIIGASRNV